MTAIELKSILASHTLWLEGDSKGVRADLSGANLRGADLSGADLSGANLGSANLSSADLSHIKDDFYDIISCAPGEIPALYKALLDGKIDGSTYHGECACLVGTIANACGTKYDELKAIVPDSERPAERWFLSIRPGDTPDNNPVSAIVKDWITSYCQAKGLALPTRTVVWK